MTAAPLLFFTLFCSTSAESDALGEVDSAISKEVRPDVLGHLSSDVPSLLDSLNDAKTSSINPAIAHAMPDPLDLGFQKDCVIDAGCLLTVFGHCACRADMSGHVSLRTIKGLKSLHVDKFDSAEVNGSLLGCMLSGCDLATTVSGRVSGEISAEDGTLRTNLHACSVRSKNSGALTTEAHVGGVFVIHGLAHVEKGCATFSQVSPTVNLTNLTFYNSSADLHGKWLSALPSGEASTDAMLNAVASHMIRPLSEIGSPLLSKAVAQQLSQSKCIPLDLNGVDPLGGIPLASSYIGHREVRLVPSLAMLAVAAGLTWVVLSRRNSLRGVPLLHDAPCC